ncbi:MAG: glycerophosphoryl diester phosphodiesterase membrane domain-containing protein [Thermoanaerobaculaceae bacterium]|nr:glycerophosphoryl diester phosphodiesterase membrane domain-containing protein [Thermoanaerobaculaceae bacterium]
MRDVVVGATRDFAAAWRVLVIADLAYKVVAVAVLTPATDLVLRWLVSRTGSQVVADADILEFLGTTRAGVVALLLGSTFIVAIAVLELGCLMAVGLATARGAQVNARSALSFGARRAADTLRLTGHMVLRALTGLVPFLLAVGLVYLSLLRGHDINYFLAHKPPAFWTAVALAAVIAGALAVLLVRTLTRWALALPIVLFEDVHPRRALGASTARSAGHRGLIALVLAAWAASALALGVGAEAIESTLARAVAPHLAGSLATLILFLTVLVILWAVLGLAVAVVSVTLLGLLIVRLYLHVGVPGEVRLPAAAAPAYVGAGPLPRTMRLLVAGVVALLAVSVALLAVAIVRRNQAVQVIAHRGASAEAPENTLAAFRLAVAEHADVVELDVQESLDGEVIVMHDSDLMKVGGSPMKIWEHTAAELRTVDIGSHKGAQFRDERVPTLAEALAVCKGSARVLIELKSYGHDQRLEERVAGIVEAAGMEKDCAYMSLDHYMVGRMKRLRPTWRVGVLVAKAYGDLTTLGADFLAVEARMATARLFVWRTHRAQQEVYAWTVNDPTWMLFAMGRGVDGLITDRPALARRVVAERAQMSDAQRLLVGMLVRAGARAEELESEHALRP